MKRSGIALASVFGAALVASGSAPAAEVTCFYNGALHPCVYYSGYPTLPASAAGIGSGLAAGIGSVPFAPPPATTEIVEFPARADARCLYPDFKLAAE